MAGIVRHPHGGQGRVHPLPDFRRGNPQVLRAKGHVLLYHAGDNLVVGVLEHHAHLAADIQQLRLVAGIHAVHIDLAPGGEEDGVKMLGQGGFARTVVAQHRHKFPGPDGQGKAVQHRGGHALPGGVAEDKVFSLEDGLGHKAIPLDGKMGGNGSRRGGKAP